MELLALDPPLSDLFIMHVELGFLRFQIGKELWNKFVDQMTALLPAVFSFDQLLVRIKPFAHFTLNIVLVGRIVKLLLYTTTSDGIDCGAVALNGGLQFECTWGKIMGQAQLLRWSNSHHLKQNSATWRKNFVQFRCNC